MKEWKYCVESEILCFSRVEVGNCVVAYVYIQTGSNTYIWISWEKPVRGSGGNSVLGWTQEWK